MQQYKLKRGFKPDIDRIYSVMEECFPGGFPEMETSLRPPMELCQI